MDDATPNPSKFMDIALSIIINESLLKEKKTTETYFGNGKGGGAFLFNMTLGKDETAMLKLQSQRAVEVFSVNLVILKNKIMYFWLDIKI